jgi:predicted flap endonuclease-1-like 5' DNA nuclease
LQNAGQTTWKRRTTMSINGITSNASTPSLATAQAAVTPPKPEAATAPAPVKSEATQTPHYTVNLTGTALAKSLKLSGLNPTQIAQKMGLDLKTVDQYLSIKVATPAPAPATPAPATATATPATPAPANAPASQGKK